MIATHKIGLLQEFVKPIIVTNPSDSLVAMYNFLLLLELIKSSLLTLPSLQVFKFKLVLSTCN